MTRGGHIAVGVSLAGALLATGYALEAVGVLLGATAPDWLEVSYYSRRERGYQRVIPHRTITHWPWLWLGALYALPHYAAVVSADLIELLPVAYGFIYGALTHLVMDLGTPSGVPLFNPFGKRTSLRIYETGRGEWKMILPTFALCFVIGLGPSWALDKLEQVAAYVTDMARFG